MFTRHPAAHGRAEEYAGKLEMDTGAKGPIVVAAEIVWKKDNNPITRIDNKEMIGCIVKRYAMLCSETLRMQDCGVTLWTVKQKKGNAAS